MNSCTLIAPTVHLRLAVCPLEHSRAANSSPAAAGPGAAGRAAEPHPTRENGVVTDSRPIPKTPRDYERSLAEVTLGTPERPSGPIELSDHDPAWAATFREQAVRIRDALGSRAHRIEHVGSTAVPDLI